MALAPAQPRLSREGSPRMSPDHEPRVLVVGGTGFVGQHVMSRLEGAGCDAFATSRNPDRAICAWPQRRFLRMDLQDRDSVKRALDGRTVAVYLAHSMADEGDYEKRETETAATFASLAAQAGIERIVYLGGVVPSGKPSKHLRSRIATGHALRAGSVSTIELQAAMIIGGGGASWRMVRDLATRLPVMILPRWLHHRSQPLAIDDVCEAVVTAITMTHSGSAAYAIPGPETLSGIDILQRVAALNGMRPLTFEVPFVTPRLSSYWIQLVTRANARVASELVEGLTSDLLADHNTFWRFMPEHQLLPFNDAASRALEEERRELTLLSRAVERGIRVLSLSAPAKSPSSS